MFPTSGPLYNTTVPSLSPASPQNGTAPSDQAPVSPQLPQNLQPPIDTSVPPLTPPSPQSSFAENPVAPALPLSPPSQPPAPPLAEHHDDQKLQEEAPDTTLETLAASLPEEDTSAASITATESLPELPPPPTPLPPAHPTPSAQPQSQSLQDLLIDVMQHIEAGKDSAATMGITELVKNGYTNEALQLYHTLAINRTSRK